MTECSSVLPQFQESQQDMDGESGRSEHHQQPMTPRQFQDWRNSLGKSSALDQDRLNLQGLDQGPAQDKETLPGLDQGPAQDKETLPGLDQGPAQDKETLPGLDQGPAQDKETLPGLDQGPAQDKETLPGLDQGPAQDKETLHGFKQGPAQDQASRNYFHQVQDQDRSLGSNKCTTEEQDPSIKVSVQDEDPPGNQDYQCNLDLEQCTAHSADQGENRLSGVNQDPVYFGPAQDHSSPHDIPILVSAGNQNQTQDSIHDLAGGMDLPHCTDPNPTPKQDQEKLLGTDQEQALVDPDRRLNPNQDHATDEACGEDAAGEQGACIPAVVITQTEGSRGPVVNQGGETAPEVTERVEAGPLCPQTPAERPEIPTGPERPQELAIAAMVPVTTLDLSPSPLSADLSPSLIEGGDLLACCDLLSLKSDTVSLARSEGYVQEEDTRSVAASSVMSVFPRIQLDPLEKDWLRSCALGNTAALRQLLTQDPSLASKKDFITVSSFQYLSYHPPFLFSWL
ncbi:uncharacterized protein LOC116374002 isoform X2 [Oncorhynchus kisutch]|uniref:uncharacterized protein LOC116374002 isoform X2 n=1 Tax=Oncorhynchus kisutch TaxID=8019 RepID=UPI0012DE9A46|nr:uncharacterized protein LOC116374002 isoform X2 [Oncorhynchus kisutch]